MQAPIGLLEAKVAQVETIMAKGEEKALKKLSPEVNDNPDPISQNIFSQHGVFLGAGALQD